MLRSCNTLGTAVDLGLAEEDEGRNFCPQGVRLGSAYGGAERPDCILLQPSSDPLML